MPDLTTIDLDHLRACFTLARIAKQRGDGPFGARLVGRDGTVLLEAGNTTASTQDVSAHAELNVVRTASSRYAPEELAGMTLFASAEPCAMCAGAIAWSGIGRVVYGLGAQRVHDLKRSVSHAPRTPGRVVMEAAVGAPVVVGPALEEEAATVFLS
jgi:tRNA(adenine34) deaminase